MAKLVPVIVIGLMFSSSAFGLEGSAAAVDSKPGIVYVAPSVVQVEEHSIFTSFALTNTTPYWFNPHIYLLDENGEIVRDFTPLLKGFGTWQQPSTEFLEEDFNGSVWIVSSQPIVATSLIFQVREGSLVLLGNSELKEMAPEIAAAMLVRLQQR